MWKRSLFSTYLDPGRKELQTGRVTWQSKEQSLRTAGEILTCDLDPCLGILGEAGLILPPGEGTGPDLCCLEMSGATLGLPGFSQTDSIMPVEASECLTTLSSDSQGSKHHLDDITQNSG